ncbi:MAG: hypothetical protein Q8L84_11705 [Hyphomonas sp.]|nr:hypothetical protein [Hyphomonas sp.]
MANWSKSSILESSPDSTDLMSVSLKRDYRLAVPADVRRAVDWLKEGPAKKDVLFELNEAGRIRVLDLDTALPHVREAMEASAEDMDDLRLIYSRGSFIRDRLDLSDPVVPHLGLLAEIGLEAGATVFVRAHAGDIEIWSDAFRAAQVARARGRQESLMEALRRNLS